MGLRVSESVEYLYIHWIAVWKFDNTRWWQDERKPSDRTFSRARKVNQQTRDWKPKSVVSWSDEKRHETYTGRRSSGLHKLNDEKGLAKPSANMGLKVQEGRQVENGKTGVTKARLKASGFGKHDFWLASRMEKDSLWMVYKNRIKKCNSSISNKHHLLYKMAWETTTHACMILYLHAKVGCVISTSDYACIKNGNKEIICFFTI